MGTVARLIPAKGLDVLIDAVPMVLREFPDTKFMIVGDGPVKSALVAKASNLNAIKTLYLLDTANIYGITIGLLIFSCSHPYPRVGYCPFGSYGHGQAGNASDIGGIGK